MTTRSSPTTNRRRKPAGKEQKMQHAERQSGTIVHWRSSGYGFVREDGSNLKVFIHVTRMTDQEGSYCDLPVGTRVEYTRVQEAQGWAARNAIVLTRPERPHAA